MVARLRMLCFSENSFRVDVYKRQTYALSEAMSNIKDKLWAVQSGSRFIESINVYIPDIDANITTYSTGKALQEQRDVYASLSSLKKDELFYKDGKLIYITESVYASWKNPEKPAFFIQTAFSNLSIGNFFSEQCDASETNMLLFCPRNGILLQKRLCRRERNYTPLWQACQRRIPQIPGSCSFPVNPRDIRPSAGSFTPQRST